MAADLTPEELAALVDRLIVDNGVPEDGEDARPSAAFDASPSPSEGPTGVLGGGERPKGTTPGGAMAQMAFLKKNKP